MKRILLVFCLGLVLCQASGQGDRVKEVGFNVSELVGLFIPFKGRNTATGPFSVVWRTGRNNNYFNFQMGARMRERDFSEENTNYTNIQIGYLRKKPLGPKFSYYTSQNILLTYGGFNIPGTVFQDFARPGLTFVGGFEYNLTEHVAIVAETSFAVIVDVSFGFDPTLTFIPPIGLFLVGRF